MDPHSRNLERLILNLQWIGEDRFGIKWIIKEGVWRPKPQGVCSSMPDIMAAFYSGRYLVAELKHNGSKFFKARSQIYNGARFLMETYGAQKDRIVGKFVIYDDNGRFNYSTVKI